MAGNISGNLFLKHRDQIWVWSLVLRWLGNTRTSHLQSGLVLGVMSMKRGRSTGGAKNKRPTKRSKSQSVQARVKAAVRKELGTEIKYNDKSISLLGANITSVSDSTTSTWVNEIVQGTGPNQRIGRKVKAVRLRFKGELECNWVDNQPDSLEIQGGRCRVVVLIDKQHNAQNSYLSGPTIFKAKTGSSDPPATDLTRPEMTVGGFRNLDNLERFHILYDKVHFFNTPTVGNKTNEDEWMLPVMYRKIKMNIPLDLPLEFNGTEYVFLPPAVTVAYATCLKP